MEAYMQYPAAHEAELEELFPAPIGEKPLNKRQSYKVTTTQQQQLTVRLKEKAKLRQHKKLSS